MPNNMNSRRRFLRGAAGTALALPFMESMAQSKTPEVPTRFAVFYVPIGVVRSSFFPGEANIKIPKFRGPNTPEVHGAELPLGWQKMAWTPTLEPLKAMQDKATLVTGLNRSFQNGTDVHAQCGSCFLTSAAPYSVSGSAWPLKRTLDHIIADKIGGNTPFRTLEFSCNSHKDNKESMYFDNISWYGTGHVAPSMRDPKKAYQRLFGSQSTTSFRNVTDLVLADAKQMQKSLSASDKEKFNEYFESIIERQVDKLENMKDELSKVKLEEPVSAHLPRGKYIRLMSDIMITALQTGLTNVATLMVGPERWETPYKYEGLFKKPMSHHKMSHNQDTYQPQLAQLDRFHMETFVYTIKRMDSIKEANGKSLLDNSLITYGSGLGDGATHQYNDLPIIVAGSAQGKIKTGRHLHYDKGTPLANLWLTQAQTLGLDIDTFADSNGNANQLLKA